MGYGLTSWADSQILGTCSAELEKLQYFLDARRQVLGQSQCPNQYVVVPKVPLTVSSTPGPSSYREANSSFTTAWGARNRGENQLNPAFLFNFENIYIYIPACFPLPGHGPW